MHGDGGGGGGSYWPQALAAASFALMRTSHAQSANGLQRGLLNSWNAVVLGATLYAYMPTRYGQLTTTDWIPWSAESAAAVEELAAATLEEKCARARLTIDELWLEAADAQVHPPRAEALSCPRVPTARPSFALGGCTLASPTSN